MKTGEVAVENSVNALRELKNSKLKTHNTMVYVTPHSQYRQQPRLHDPQIAQFQPHLYPPAPMPYRPQPIVALQSYAVAQPMYAYQRCDAAAAKPFDDTTHRMRRIHQQPPPPPLPQQESGSDRIMKPSLQQHSPPPVSLPVQLQASAGSCGPRWQPKRSVCVRYARGSCNYGSSCKFLHEDNGLFAMPRSAPADFGERSQLKTSAAPERKTQSRIASSLQDADFPSLSVQTVVSDHFVDSPGSRHAQKLPASSPPKKLVFLDAVLQQNCAANQTRPVLPTPTNVTQEGTGNSMSGDNEKAHSSHQTAPDTDEEDEHQRVVTGCTKDTRSNQSFRRSHDQDLRRYANTKQSTRSDLFRRASLPAEQLTHKSRLKAVLPEPGRSAYIIQPVYVGGLGAGTDDSAAFRALCREANGFVKRLDARLRELFPFRDRAISKLQDVVASLWSDSTISVYGSNFTRLALPQSDVDCVLTTPSHTCELPSELLRRLAAELQRHSWARRVELVDSAKIPVLKVVFSPSSKSRNDVMLDLTCAHSPGHSGLSARDLIYSCQAKMPALRPLVLILKSHIQRRGLNNAYTGGLSSYGLVVLAIRFLQACGDEHHLQEQSIYGHIDGGHHFPESGVHVTQLRSNANSSSPAVYEFTRDGKVTWRTGLGNLLLLFLETYVTFDYRRFGVTIEGTGHYFPLPSEMVPSIPGAVVSPYIIDPISTTRSIGNCFRMHEIIQAWYELYHNLTNGVSLDDAINRAGHAIRPA